MVYRLALLCLCLMLFASGTANAARGTCPVAEAQRAAQMAMTGAHADCDMVTEAMEEPDPSGDMNHSGDTACCCPAIVAALPGPVLQAGAATLYPPLYDTPLNTALISLSTVPEPPPPRA